MPQISAICFVIAYLILGREVLLTALKNMKTGHVMDENFLMSIATIGAFCVGQFGEAVGVMLFYRSVKHSNTARLKRAAVSHGSR